MNEIVQQKTSLQGLPAALVAEKQSLPLLLVLLRKIFCACVRLRMSGCEPVAQLEKDDLKKIGTLSGRIETDWSALLTFSAAFVQKTELGAATFAQQFSKYLEFCFSEFVRYKE